MSIKVLALDCTSDAGADQPRIDELLREVLSEFANLGVEGELVFVANANIDGPGNGWPALRTKILGSQIVLIGTPAAAGQPTELTDAILTHVASFAHETDGYGHQPSYGKVAAAITAGPSAAQVSGQIVGSLIDAGFSVAANAVVSRAGQEVGVSNEADLHMMVRNTAHLAGLLRATSYPPQD